MAACPSDPSAIVVQQVAVNRILELRHAVLRADLPKESARFDGDEAPGTIHVAACQGDLVVGCATYVRQGFEGEDAYRLRGMATAPQWQRHGLGHRLLTHAEELLRNDPIRLRWCNAREPAIGFYLKEGWTVVSELFDIPTAGPHRRMIRRC